MLSIYLILIVFLIYIIHLLSYSLIRGAPFAPLGKERIDTMFELLNCRKGKKLADLGSGDGRIVIEAAKHGVMALGFEINPVLTFISKQKIKKNKINNAKVFNRDYWKENFSSFDYITLYGAPHIMKRLEKKLNKELKPGAKVVSNHFRFPNLKVAKQLNDVYLYIF